MKISEYCRSRYSTAGLPVQHRSILTLYSAYGKINIEFFTASNQCWRRASVLGYVHIFWFFFLLLNIEFFTASISCWRGASGLGYTSFFDFFFFSVYASAVRNSVFGALRLLVLLNGIFYDYRKHKVPCLSCGRAVCLSNTTWSSTGSCSQRWHYGILWDAVSRKGENKKRYLYGRLTNEGA